MDSEVIGGSILQLPNEVLTQIFSFLSPEDLVDNVGKTCFQWNNIVNTNALWRLISFNPRSEMPDAVLLYYIKKMPLLKFFYLDHERHVDNIVVAMCEHCTDIKSVIIKNKMGPTRERVTEILMKFEQMECFEVVINNSQLNLDFARLYGMYHSPRSVNLLANKGPQTNNFILNPVLGYFPYLSDYLSLPFEKIRSVLTKKRENIHTLGLNCDICPEVFNLVCSCKELRYLLLCDTESVGANINVLLLSNLTNLHTLQLLSFRDNFTGFPTISFENVRFPHLKKLEIVFGGSQWESALTSLLRCCPKLRHLNVKDNILTDEHFLTIRFCKELEYLDVSRNYQLSDNFILTIAAGCRKLKFLDISNCVAVTERFIFMLHTLEKLRTLRIEGRYYSGMYFNSIPVIFPNLIEFYVKHFRNTELLTDILSKMPTLRIMTCNKDPEECEFSEDD